MVAEFFLEDPIEACLLIRESLAKFEYSSPSQLPIPFLLTGARNKIGRAHLFKSRHRKEGEVIHHVPKGVS